MTVGIRKWNRDRRDRDKNGIDRDRRWNRDRRNRKERGRRDGAVRGPGQAGQGRTRPKSGIGKDGTG